METSWHSWALVEPEKSRLLSAVLAPHCSGVGVAPQFSWATWFATASFHMASHWAAVEDAVITLDAVSRPPDAVMSWLTVTSVLAKPTYPAELMLTPVPSVPSTASRTVTCWEVILVGVRYEPMENPASGVMAAIEVLVTDECPPTKICGTDCRAVTLTALQMGAPLAGTAWKHCTVLVPIFDPAGVKVPFCHTPVTWLSVAPDPLSVSAYGSFKLRYWFAKAWVL